MPRFYKYKDKYLLLKVGSTEHITSQSCWLYFETEKYWCKQNTCKDCVMSLFSLTYCGEGKVTDAEMKVWFGYHVFLAKEVKCLPI